MLIGEQEPYVLIAEEEKAEELLAQLHELGRTEIRGVVWNEAVLPKPLTGSNAEKNS